MGPIAERWLDGETGAVDILRSEEQIGSVAPPIAVDAEGETVAASYRVEGRELLVSVDHRSADARVVDGEVVALDGAQTSFARLAQRGQRPVAVFLCAFDLLHLAGHDTTALPLRSRKALLRHALTSTARCASRRSAIATARTCSARPAARVGRV